MKTLLAGRPRLRAVAVWALLIVVAVVLFRLVEPAVFESPYNNF